MTHGPNQVVVGRRIRLQFGAHLAASTGGLEPIRADCFPAAARVWLLALALAAKGERQRRLRQQQRRQHLNSLNFKLISLMSRRRQPRRRRQQRRPFQFVVLTQFTYLKLVGRLECLPACWPANVGRRHSRQVCCLIVRCVFWPRRRRRRRWRPRRQQDTRNKPITCCCN